MRSLPIQPTADHPSARTKAARIRCSAAEPTLPTHGTVLVEARTVTGEHHHLQALVGALREQAKDHSGHLGEVHFSDQGDRMRVVNLWRSPDDLRSFVEETHREVLAYRAAVGGFPTVERALWWSTAGTGITAAEAEERAGQLRARGPGPRAFTLGSPVPAPA
ncbi:DUF3291 domain-containing protein [Nocardiopsis terrae]